MANAVVNQMQGVRAKNAELNAEEYRLRKIRLDSRPTMVYLELTQNCNLSCHMCRHANSFSSSKNMSDKLFEKTLEELASTASWMDLRGWGESTILPTFTDKLRKTAATGVRVLLVTNGLLITEEQFELICGSRGIVSLSVDAASPELYLQLGRGDFNRVMANARVGSAIASRLGIGEVYFHTVVSSYNLHHLSQIVELAASVGIRRVVFSPIKTWEGHIAGLSRAANGLHQQVSAATARARELGVVLQLSSALHEDHVIKEALFTTCASPWSRALIDYEGNLIFCDHLLNKKELSMGSVVEVSFERVWNGDLYQALRETHIRAERLRSVSEEYQKCNWCYKNRYKDSEAPPIPAELLREVSTVAVGPRRLV